MNLPSQPIMQVAGVVKNYGKHTVLDHVSLEIAPGEVLCILGPNGAGKTTLISAILGLIDVEKGDILLFGERQTGIKRSNTLRQQVGVMMQIGSLSANLTVFEQCDLFSSYYQQGHSAAELVSLAGLENQSKQTFGRLSGGQKQRLLFALALAGKPRLLFLDEPTLGMDVEARQNLWQLIFQLKAQGVSVVLTTHYLEEAEQLADRILVLHQGAIIANDSPAQLKALTNYKVIQCRSALSDADLLALPAVVHLSRTQDNITLHSKHVELTVKTLLLQDSSVSQLEVRPVALEQAFLQLTQQTKPTQEHVA